MAGTDRADRCARMIHGASLAAGCIGTLSPLPLADSALIMPLQVMMVMGLAREFGVDPSESVLTGALYASAATMFGRAGSEVLTALIPGLGGAIRGATACAVTEGLGSLVLRRLERGRGFA